MIRLLLVEDSITQREILRRLLTEDGEFTVVAEARNGQEAIDMVEKHRPDVVLMDIHMPDVDGVTATRLIMKRTPVPIVVASASLKKQDVDLGLEALNAGAVSVIEKPQGAVLLHLAKIAPHLRAELIAASKARVSQCPGSPGPSRLTAAPKSSWNRTEVVGICASTGGPPVLMKILSQIPKPYPLPILLVQHIASGFVEGFARWLGNQSGQVVNIASPRQPLAPGVWLAPGGQHLLLGDRERLELLPSRPEDIHCPSGNVLFESLADRAGSRALGILLTGMGNDGAAGLLKLRRSGGQTIIQDEASSLIFGMPKAARDQGAAQFEYPPENITEVLHLAAQPGSGDCSP